jgi:alanyl-tRNA synthetase
MKVGELRQNYLDFFSARGHKTIPSASLLPENDPTTLFTGSGMQPMIPYLLGEKHPLGKRVTDSQKCFRAMDVEEVGDNRHTTFFEMLGNWSLGDYYKQEQIPWIAEFIFDTLGLDSTRVYITCFRGNKVLGIDRDEESVNLWKQEFRKRGIEATVGENPETDGLVDNSIFYYGEDKNWWSRVGAPDKMPIGEPGGPDTEMFWDFAPDEKIGSEPKGFHEQSKWKDQSCHVNCDCGRFLEIGNSVFMEYVLQKDGFTKLGQKNVDFGGGLERLSAAVIDSPDIYEIDVFAKAKSEIERISGKIYKKNESDNRAFRVIMDHIRAATFLIADGAVPANKDQGYFTRRLMRRAIRFGHHLEIQENFCATIAESYIKVYADAYPDLTKNKESIVTNMQKEEEKFRKTLAEGLKKFEELTMDKKKGSEISGKEIFDLYQSFGFPVEVSVELASDKGFVIDKVAFNKEKTAHQELSRAGAAKKFHGGLADHSEESIRGHTATHLLHAALRAVLGEHVQQKGSNITPDRIRFDFSHPAKLSEEEKKRVEDLVNAAVSNDYPVTWQEMTVEQAYKKNTIGFFPERYDDVVKVYTIGEPNRPMLASSNSPTFSQEICGGPHVKHTGMVGMFKITKEEALGAGLRRIKAVLG